MDNKKLYKVLVATVVGDLSYEAGQTYELSDEQVAAFAEGEIELVATPDSVTPEVPGSETPETPVAPATTDGAPTPSNDSDAPQVEPATPWAGNHKV